MKEDSAPSWALEMTHTLGEIRGELTSLNDNFSRHLDDDAKLRDRIDELEFKRSNQAGAAKVWGLIATALSSIGGGVIVHLIERNK